MFSWVIGVVFCLFKNKLGNVVSQILIFDIICFDSDCDVFVVELGVVYCEWGFVGICNYGILQVDIDVVYDVFKVFFVLLEEIKCQYYVLGSGGVCGYILFGVEIVKGFQYFDLKEFWYIGCEILDDFKYCDVMVLNLWLFEVFGFCECGYGLYQVLDNLGLWVLLVLVLYIGLLIDFFVDKINNGNLILCLIYYLLIIVENIFNVCVGVYGDINFIMLLVGVSVVGLEVQLYEGKWVLFIFDVDIIVVNIGDMLQCLINYVYLFIIYCVVNFLGEQVCQLCYLVLFFLYFNLDFLIDVLLICIILENLSCYLELIIVYGFLEECLCEIKLK